MHKFFNFFLVKMKSSFRRIARAARHEVTEGDLQSDAWVVAHEISERRGHPVDFSEPADQDLVIRAVNLNNVRRGDWHMRKSVRIDEEREGEDGTVKWSEKLAAASTADPLKFLLKREAARENDVKFAASYSQAAAYVRVFARFKYNRKDVCSHLVVADATLTSRVSAAAAMVAVQPSLFDGIHRIGVKFLPPRGRAYVVQPVLHLGSVQWAWSFDEAGLAPSAQNCADGLLAKSSDSAGTAPAPHVGQVKGLAPATICPGLNGTDGGEMNHPIAWVKLDKYVEMTGDTIDAVQSRRKAGKWLDGNECKVVDGRIWIDLRAIERWVGQ